MIKRIITHGGTAHADDFLAVAILLTKFPKAEVLRVDTIDSIDDESEAIFIDIGGKFDNEVFFDHHHDKNLPASLTLVIQRFFPEIPVDLDELRFINDWDTKGPIATQKIWNLRLPEFRDPIAEMVLRLFSKATIIKPGDFLHEMLKEIGKEFLNMLREQSEFINEAKRAEVLTVKGLKVVKLDTTVPIRFIKKVHDVAVVIQPNQRVQGAVTLTRVDDHPRVDFNRLRNKVPTHFIHPNGFMAVVDPEHIDKALELAIV